MTDPKTWILAQLDADEAMAKAATHANWSPASTSGMGFAVHSGEHGTIALYLARPDATHIATQDPAATLRRCEALRKVAKGLARVADGPASEWIDVEAARTAAWATLIGLADIWADRPGHAEAVGS